MPWTMAAFTVAALGMIGVPPLAGFISKWQLGLGSLLAGEGWAVAVLLASSLLNAAYFLPVIHRAWFRPADPEAVGVPRPAARDAPLTLLAPTLTTALLALLFGLLAALPVSPLRWAQFISSREFPP